MALIEFKDLPDTSTPLTAENLNFNFNEIFNLVFPIGKVEVFFDNEDHSDYMGFTWERTAIGKVPVGIDSSDTDFNSIGKTGGSKEMQSHSHTFVGRTQLASLASGGTGTYIGAGTTNTSTEGTGDSGNLQPYEVMAFWKRVS